MKRKIALLLAFVMIFSLLPIMSVSAARLGGGPVPTIPNVEAGLLVAPSDYPNATTWVNAVEGRRHIPLAARSLSLDMNNFPVGADNTAEYRAIVRLTGLDSDDNNGTFVAHPDMIATPVATELSLITPASDTTTQEALQAMLEESFGITNIRFRTPADNISTPLRNEVLAYGVVRINPVMEAALIRDGDNRDRAILYIAVNSSGQPVPAGFGASVPINYITYSDEDVVMNITWPSGLAGLPNRIPLANRHSDEFTFALSDDPVRFNTRTRIPAIEIREPAGLGFNSNGNEADPTADPPVPERGWDVIITLERGFAWDRRHAGRDASVALGMDVGGALGLRFPDGFSNMRVSSLFEVNRERDRELQVRNIKFANAPDSDRFQDILLIGDGDTDNNPDGYLWVTAGDNARFGPVRANVELYAPGDLAAGNDPASSDWVTIAEYSDAQVYFFRDEDENLEDYVLPSGRREWEFGFTLEGNRELPDAVWDGSPDDDYHQTAWVVLTESVRGVLPFTGMREIAFEFPEGAQVLGLKWETNEGNFVAEQDDTDGESWYFDGRTRDGPMDILITRNRVTMRPEIGRDDGREEVAEVRLQFYVSIEPEYENLYGEELWVHTYGPGFEDGYRAQVAIIRDPITVETTPINIGDGDVVAAGMLRHIEIEPVYVHETDTGALEWDLDVAIFVEENTFQDAVAANAINIRSFTVETDGASGLEVGVPRNTGRDTRVSITRTSGAEPGWIRFSDIQITGLVIPGHEYSITVVGTAVAQNHVSETTNVGAFGGRSARVPHGFWGDEPYLSPAFGFDGTDTLAPAPAPPPAVTPPVDPGTTTDPGTTVTPPVTSLPPRTLFQNQPFVIQSGPQAGMSISPTFSMVPFGNGENASAFIAAAAIGDVLGWENSWDPATNTGTFFLPDGRVVAFQNGSNAVNVNGQQQFMINADGSPANARIINDRFMIHIRFFEQLGVNITWLGGTPGNNSMIVTP